MSAADTDLLIAEAAIEAMTGYAAASKQLQVLHNRGFHRAFINRAGRVVLERSHYEAVTRGGAQSPTHGGTKAANLSFLRPKRAA